MIKQELKLERGASKTGQEEVGILTREQVEKIAKAKMADLNTDDLEPAIKMVEGTARSMGVKIK
jgi:large subunit ribosomal protein L11